MRTASGAYLCRPEEAELRWMGEASTSFLARGEQTGEAFALVDERAKRGESVPLHLHRDDMESFYVLEGEITFFIGDQPGSPGEGRFVSSTYRVTPFTAFGSSRRPPATSRKRVALTYLCTRDDQRRECDAEACE